MSCSNSAFAHTTHHVGRDSDEKKVPDKHQRSYEPFRCVIIDTATYRKQNCEANMLCTPAYSVACNCLAQYASWINECDLDCAVCIVSGNVKHSSVLFYMAASNVGVNSCVRNRLAQDMSVTRIDRDLSSVCQ